MFQAWRGRHDSGLVGIEASPDGIAIAHVVAGSGGRPRLQRCHFIASDAEVDDALPADADGAASHELMARPSPPSADQRPWANQLKDKIQQLGLGNHLVNWVMPSNQYSLLLVEAPKVPPEELRDAIRWRIKDLSPLPVEEATLDVFQLPQDGTRNAARMVYVVVARKLDVQHAVDLVQTTRLKLHSIDIVEMCLRNLAERVVEDNRGIAFVRLRPGSGNLALVRQEKLYLSRQFDLPYNGGLFDALPEEQLVLELQRSLDYYERQMGQVPPSRIVFCGDNVSTDKITDNLRFGLPGHAECLQMPRVLEGVEPFDENLLGLCLGAIGGAMRRLVAA